MSVTQYIGARYVPLFAEPAEWSSDRTYEPLTIVLHQGNSYTSRQFVPKGIDITNASFWALTGNYNAQLEQYRQEVLGFGERIDAVETSAQSNATAISNETTRATAAEQANATSISDEVTRATAAEQANATAISNEVTRATGAEQANADAISAEVTRATAAEQANADAISAEVTRATTADNALSGRIASLENSVQDHLVIIGDSYTEPSWGLSADDMWWHYVAEQLNLTPHSYAVGGTGFMNPKTPTFNEQVNQAYADTSFDNGAVRRIIIMGGLNDLEYSDVAPGVTTTVNNARNKFPNAEILVCAMPSWVSTDNAQYAQSQRICVASLTTGVAFTNMNGVLIGRESWFGAESHHPNADGQKALASKVMCAIGGGPCILPWREISLTATAGTNTNARLSIINNQIIFTGQCVTDANGTLKLQIPYGLANWIEFKNNIVQAGATGTAWWSVNGSELVIHAFPASTTVYCGANLGSLPV